MPQWLVVLVYWAPESWHQVKFKRQWLSAPQSGPSLLIFAYIYLLTNSHSSSNSSAQQSQKKAQKRLPGHAHFEDGHKPRKKWKFGKKKKWIWAAILHDCVYTPTSQCPTTSEKGSGKAGYRPRKRWKCSNLTSCGFGLQYLIVADWYTPNSAQQSQGII